MVLTRIVSMLGIRSLKGRLLFFFISFLIILALLAFIPLIIIGKEQRFKDAEIEMKKMIQLQEVFIEEWFDDHLSNITALAKSKSVQEKDYEEMDQLFKTYKDNYTEYSGIMYVDHTGMTRATTREDAKINVAEREYFKEAAAGKSHISEVLFGRISQQQIITISVPVIDEEDVFQGVVIGSVKIETINNLMNEITDAKGETYIVDKQGFIITTSRQGEIGERIKTEIYDAAKAHEEINTFYETKDGKSVLGNYAWVNDDRWLIVGEIYKQDINKPFNQVMIIFVIGFTVISIIGSLMISWLFRQIEQPILRVLKGTRKMGNGEWDYRLKEYKFDVRELQELSSNFNTMASLIEDHVDSLMKSEERFRTIAEYSSDMISIHELDGSYLYVSPAGKEMLQYEDEEIIGRKGIEMTHPDDLPHIAEKVEELEAVGYAVFTYRIQKKDGNYVWFESSLKKLKMKEKQLIYSISRNITERKQVEEQLKEANDLLRHLSSKDGLTGIWNRRTFDENYRKTWIEALSNNRPIGLMLLDIDYFKKYNDTYGHQVGDDCLVEIATAIESTAEIHACHAYRYGGEEFVVIFYDIPKDKLVEIAEDIRKAIEDLHIPHISSAIQPYVTISAGVNITIPSIEQKPLQFLKETDIALYKAKNCGRNNVQVFNKEKEA